MIAELGANASAGKVLEVGCGASLVLAELASIWPEAAFVGLEAAPRLVRKTGDPRISIHRPAERPAGRGHCGVECLGIHVTVNFRSVKGTCYYSRKYPTASSDCPNACLWGEETLTLPMYPSLSRDEQNYVIKVVREQVYPLARSSS